MTTEGSTGGQDSAASISDVLTSGIAAERARPRTRRGASRSTPPVSLPTAAEREAKGRAARERTPREALAEWEPPADRPDPVDLLEGQEATRVQELVPVRHARMAVSAFTFYRGSALVMASDLSSRPRSGLAAQLCGDAHLSNFGMFAAPDRSVVFDVNDFDETHPGPFEWDVKRLAASFVLAARDNGLSAEVARLAAETAATAYRESIRSFAAKPELAIWYDRIDASGIDDTVRDLSSGARAIRRRDSKLARSTVAQAVSKARTRDAWSVISKITEVVDGHRRFRDQPPLLSRLDLDAEARGMLNHLFHEYRSTLQDDRQELLKRYEIVDFGHKVVGVGSVGLLAFVLLMRGRDEDDLLVLQVKQAQASVLESFTKKSTFSKHGHRVVTGQRLMQAASDSFLGWIDGPAGRSYYVRQLRDMKWSPDPATLDEMRLPRFAALCGHTLARAHARSGDAIAIGAYLGKGRAFDRAIAAFSTSYADQVAVDFEAFTAAIAGGDVAAHESAAGTEGVALAASIVG